MSNDERPSDRLQSWKDIAAYLGRDVSTVQRWEKREAMPVHRHLHEKLGSVYAFRSELEVWWRGRSSRLSTRDRHDRGAVSPAAPEATEPGPSQADHPVEQPSGFAQPRHTQRPLVVLGIVALGVAGALAVGFRITRDPGAAGDVRPAVAAPVSGTTEVQDLLLRAKYLAVRTTDADSRNAIALVARALVIDPSSAPAYAALASAYVTRLAYVRPEETRELEEKAFAAAEKALSLDPAVPEAYLARGDLLWTRSQRFAHDRAVQEFRRALSLDPDSDEVHRRLARVYVHVGFLDEALQHADRALLLNPSNAQALNSRAQALLWRGNDEEALSTFASIPGPVLPELVEANTAYTLMRLARHEEAWSYLRQALHEHPNDPTGTLRGVESMMLAQSDPSRARTLIDAVARRTSANPSHHAAYFAACASARMGRAQEAVRWLREAAETGFPCYPLFARDPSLDPIRDDPTFLAFMAEMARRSASLRSKLFPVGH